MIIEKEFVKIDPLLLLLYFKDYVLIADNAFFRQTVRDFK
jgi:hypothetical protein